MFFRRPDLDLETRMSIATQAYWNQGVYGAITKLAATYDVSRKFIYRQLAILQLSFILETTAPSAPEVVSFPADQFMDQMILLLRLEGNCSIPQISNILSALGVSPHAVGTISQRLSRHAQKLTNTLPGETVQLVMFLSDEIFAKSQPILITIEPRSCAILRIELAEDRTGESWKEHWTIIEENNFYCLGVNSDRGTGLQAGFKDFESKNPDAEHNFDLFHDFRDLSSACLVLLHTAANKAIGKEYHCWNVLDSARSERVINKRINAYEQALQDARQAVDRYDTAETLFRRSQEILEVFDKDGSARDRQDVQKKLEAILDQLIALGDETVTKEAKHLKTQLPSMLHYFDQAKVVVENLSKQIKDPNVRRAFCLAWQWNNKIYQAKSTAQKKNARYEKDFWLLYAKEHVGQNDKVEYEDVFEQLDIIVRSSSLVEMVNSLIRPYLNTCRGQITQEMLNLIMFYHNHHPFNTGKRKGKAPIEILTGKKMNQHWTQRLMAA